MSHADRRIERISYSTVADLLRALWREHLLTQQELATHLGLDRAQLCRYEKGVQEPSLATLRKMLDALGWALTLALEPSTAEVDRRLDEPFDAGELLGLDVPALLEVAAAAVAKGADLVVGGEVAAVLQGVPVESADLVFHVRPAHVDVLVRAARTRVAATERYGEPGRLELRRVDVVALVVPVEVLPASRVVRREFRPWLSGRELPVVDLAVLYESGGLGPAAMALVARMAERAGAESIP